MQELITKLKQQTGTTTDSELQQALKKAYYEGKPLISDSDYDQMFKEDPLGYDVSNATAWSKYKHNAESIQMVKYKKLEDALKHIELNGMHPSVIEHKLDGINITCYYIDGTLKHVVTRGSGIEGEDIYCNGLSFEGVKSSINTSDHVVAVRGELVMSNANFAKITDGNYSNRRNSTAGIARRLDGKYSELLTFIAYKIFTGISETEQLTEWDTNSARDFLTSQGFTVPANLLDTGATLEEIYSQCAETRDTYDLYPHDGLVIKSDKYQFALKYNANTCYTKITGYSWSLGSTHKYVPVVWFEPVVIGGATLTKASMASAKNFVETNAPIGSIVEIARANEVIPYLKAVIERSDAELEIPKECPECHEPLEWQGANLVCTNVDCRHRMLSRCENLLGMLGIPRFNLAQLWPLVESGKIKEATDVLFLVPEDLIAIGTSPQQALKILEQVKQRHAILTEYDVLYTCNIGKLSFNNMGAVEALAKEQGKTLAQAFEDCDESILIPALKRAKTSAVIDFMTNSRAIYDKIKHDILDRK